MAQIAEPRSGAPSSASPADIGRISHWIGGRVVAGTSGREGPIYDPATGRRTYSVDFASVEESTFEQDLWHLGGFSGTGWCL